ncbi:MAG TPA: VWA domain-containing protein [Pyrinomonadaceae bacterium]|nr:VWA domain-containing protein [Pyrinomonadaceae bacterium]
MKYLTLCLCLAILANGIRSQTQPPKEEVVRVETDLVDVPISVRLANGSNAGGLKAANFLVFEDGKRQEIEGFSATTAPFEVALLLDTSGSTRNDLQLIQRAAKEFIASLRLGDRVAIIAFTTKTYADRRGPAVDLIMKLTDDRAALNVAINRLQTSFGTPYYDALETVVEQIFSEKPSTEFRGRRALVALTDGVDSTSYADFESAKDVITPANFISYFIKVDTREYFESQLLGDCESAIRFSSAQIRRYYKSIKMNASAEKASRFCELGEFERLAVSKRLYEIADNEMSQLAKTSGGTVFPIDDLTDARNAFRSVASEIGTKYTLSYYPSNEKRDGSFRRIKVELKGLPAGSTVKAREGYTAPKN